MSTSPYTPGSIQGLSDDECPPNPRLSDSLGLCSDLDFIKRDRFELLSAYLDGEVTPEERRLVQTWLHNDPTAKCLYNRLMALRYGLRQDACTIPCEAETTLTGVFQCLNHRFRMVVMAGAGVVVVGVLNLLSGTVGSSPAQWSVAREGTPTPKTSPSLHITLDKPAFPIPETTAIPAEGQPLQSPTDLPIDTDL